MLTESAQRIPHLFKLVRTEDLSGMSGVGLVAWGVEFPDKTCAMRWNTDTSSTATYNCIEDLELIHGHQGRTKVEWL